LDVYRETQQKFEKMHQDVRDRARKEKEDLVKRQLEEEERRLAAELIARPNRVASAGGLETTNAVDLSATRAPLTGGPRSSTPAPLPSTFASSARYPASQAPHPSAYGVNSSMTVAADTSAYSMQSHLGGPRAASAAPAARDEDDRATAEIALRRREKLQQLWLVLDMPETAREQFNRTIAPPVPAPEALSRINQEIRRLELQLPLLELMTRRQFLLHRTQEIEQHRAKAAASGVELPPAQAAQHQRQLEDLERERRDIEQKLAEEIPKHEARYGGPLLFRGRPFSDVLRR
jgi:hypothetical protein